MDDGRLDRVVSFYNENRSYLPIKMWHNIEKVMYMDLEKTQVEGWTLSQLMKNKHTHIMHSIKKLDTHGFELYTFDIVNLSNDSRNDVYEGSYVISPIIEGVIYLMSLKDGDMIPITPEYDTLKLVGNLAELKGED